MKNLLLRALAAVVSLAFTLALCETLLAQRYRDRAHGLELMAPGGSPYLHRPSPSKGEINDRGMRRESDVSERAAAGTTRILSYGDSIAHGFRVPLRETYSHLLEKMLDAKAIGSVEVLNMARGHSPTIYSFHIRKDVPRLMPQVVLLQIELLNDVSDEAHALTRGMDEDGLPLEILRYRYLLTHHGQLLSPLTWRGSSLERTLVYGLVTRWIGRSLSKLRPSPLFAPDSEVYYYSRKVDRYYLTESTIEAGFDRLFSSLEGIHRFLRGRDVDFLVAMVPSQYVFDAGRYSAHADRVLKRAEERAHARGIPFLSLRRAMAAAGGDRLYFDFCHPTADGNRVIAEALFAALDRLPTARRESDRVSAP